MNSKKIMVGRFDIPTSPAWLDSTRVILRRIDPNSNYCSMVSNHGSAWAWTKAGLHRQKPEIARNPGLNRNHRNGRSYALIMVNDGIRYNGKRGSDRASLHRCVAQVYVRVPRKLARLNIKLVIDHRNGDRYDNRPENLRWCTQSQNIRYSNRARKGLPV